VQPPKPKRVENAKSTPRVVSIMASMDAETRHRFTERANEASERKEAVRQEKTQTQHLAIERKSNQRKKQEMLKIKQQGQGLGYWFFSQALQIYIRS